MTRLKKLLSGDRASDEEIERLAGYLIKVNGTVFGEEELIDMRIAEELKQRQLQRLKESQTNPKNK